MTALAAIIKREIALSGPMSVQRYMELCLTHPRHGYYVTRDPLGRSGDFITAPEISQMFGEMIGTWVASVWHAMGRPDFHLVELGPGRGTLMADINRVLTAAGAGGAATIWLVEASPVLRAEQARRIEGAHWVDRLDDVPAGPSIILANEFLDALPVRQFLAAGQGWCERLVGISDDDTLIWGLSSASPGPVAAGHDWAERSGAVEGVAGAIHARVQAGQSAALVVDYGYRAQDRPAGPTLQALHRHARADALDAPGEADLTWLIDFDDLRRRIAGSQVTTQGRFLAQMGIGARAVALAGSAPGQAEIVAGALERLTQPAQMGTLFKVLGAVSPGLPQPPGFAEIP